MLIKSLILFTVISVTCASYLEYDGWLNIQLLHSLDRSQPDKFTNRGNVSISSLNTGSFSLQQAPLEAHERKLLKQLAESDEMYRLKAIVTSQDGDQNTFLTYSKACALANSQLTDVLWIALNHAGSVLSVSQTISGNGNCQDRLSVHVDALEEFNTDVYVKHTESAPIPDTASFIQKIERERDARDRGEVKDNRGFIAKYWMYIVPVVILLFVSGAANPDGGSAAR